MEDITICIRVDKAYRSQVESLGVGFEEFLTGILIQSLMKGGKMNKLARRVNAGSIAAKSELVNIASLGEVMKEIVTIL